MEFVKNVLGVPIRTKIWPHNDALPYFITDRYQIHEVLIGNVKALFLSPKGTLEPVNTLKKHMMRIQKEESLPIVFIVPEINAYRRKSLIQNNIPFIVPDSQIYLPFMGVLLQEHYAPSKVPVEKFAPCTQVLLFYYLYEKKKCLYMSEAVSALDYSAMAISKAAKQLSDTGLFTERKEGVLRVLEPQYDRKELFVAALSYLINPVKKRFYAEQKEQRENWYKAGITALAENSMLNPSAVPCYAIARNAQVHGTAELIDTEAQVEVEIWKYDPGMLARTDTVDLLSLYMTLKDNNDERVEEAIEEQMEAFWKE